MKARPYADVFPDPLVVQWLLKEQGGRRTFVLFERHRLIRQNGEIDECEKGLVSDGASIPTFLWWVESPYGYVLEAAVHHDRRYREKIGTRAEADKLFLEGMMALGVPAWKRQVIYWGVRAFGWQGWGT